MHMKVISRSLAALLLLAHLPLAQAQDEAYYLPQVKVEKLPRLRRGRKFVSGEGTVRNVPRADARWIGELLKQLSPDQIADAFHAAGYTPEQVSAYTQKVSERIDELTKL
jgi:hypothetical protein